MARFREPALTLPSLTALASTARTPKLPTSPRTTLRTTELQSGDAKGAHVRFTGTYSQGFLVAGNEVTLGQYGTYVDATLAFGVIGGGNRVNVSTKPIYVATSHAQSAITILDDSKSAGAATIVADVNSDTHVFQPLLNAQPFYNQKSSTTAESVTGLTFINLTNSAGRTLTTLTGGAKMQTVTLYQAGSGTTTLTHGTGTDALSLPCAANDTLTTGQSKTFWFNGTAWKQIAGSTNNVCLSAALPVNQGGTGTTSTLTGLMRGNSSAMTAAELSGDATTSGSNAVTVTKLNGVSLAGLSTGILKNTTRRLVLRRLLRLALITSPLLRPSTVMLSQRT
jgi:hypothetical protein